MIAPKINGWVMTEVCEGDWEYITNGLEINVYCPDEVDDPELQYSASIKLNGHYLHQPCIFSANTAQGAADQAVKFLHGLGNIINYIK